ncbi:MAG: 30S ribosomal protein S3 [Candidatus Zixiibacteriota bacterium]|nr:MAG: 30S ribosomal protein S3 [candidate division Zixibacteria bacterium]
MGQKTHPIGLRLGITRTWNSRWFAPDRNFSDLIYEDMMIKRYINQRLDNAGIANVCISRAPKKVTVDIHTSRPGIVIGRKGAEVDKLREELQLLTKKDILLNIVEVRKPELDAQLVADSIARQLEGRVSFRRAMKKSLAATMKMGATGIKIQCAGRLGGAEIARTEKYREGRVPLHTLRADIDYATSTARTTYGTIGVKVWISRGEIMETGQFYAEEETRAEMEPEAPSARSRRPRGGDRARKRPRGRIRRKTGGAIVAEDEAPRGRRPERPARTQGDKKSRESAPAGAPGAEKTPASSDRPPKTAASPRKVSGEKKSSDKPKDDTSKS